jgi:hypothetical protein
MQEARSPAVTSQRTAVIRRPAGLFYRAADKILREVRSTSR